RSGDHDAPGRVVAFGTVHGRGQGVHQPAAEDIAARRVVKGHHRDAVPLRQPDQVICAVWHLPRLLRSTPDSTGRPALTGSAGGPSSRRCKDGAPVLHTIAYQSSNAPEAVD